MFALKTGHLYGEIVEQGLPRLQSCGGRDGQQDKKTVHEPVIDPVHPIISR
jgi:hypothetical protein